MATGDLQTGPVQGVYESRDPIPLIVVDKENGTVTVRVHNIGSEDADGVDILLYEDLDGGLRLAGGIRDVTIPAPSGLEPSIHEVDLTIWYEPWIGEAIDDLFPTVEGLDAAPGLMESQVRPKLNPIPADS